MLENIVKIYNAIEDNTRPIQLTSNFLVIYFIV